MSKFEHWNDYIYENGTLKNKLNIKDAKFLAWKEEEYSKKSVLSNIKYLQSLDPFNPEVLKQIHKIIFKDIYEWAGEYRNVDMSKNRDTFEHWKYLQYDTEDLLKKQNLVILTQNKLSKEFISKKLEAIFDTYNYINYLHHFKEGNGRVGRIWLNLVLEKVCNKHIDFSKIDRDDYHLAMRQSFKKSSLPIYEVLEHELINLNLKSYEKLFTKNLDASYYYEYLEKYKSKQLLKNIKAKSKAKEKIKIKNKE